MNGTPPLPYRGDTGRLGGRGLTAQSLSKARRAARFCEAVGVLAALPGLEIVAVIARRKNDEMATERLIRLLETHAKPGGTRIIADAGREPLWNRLWHRAAPAPLEPLQFGDSSGHDFLQMADFAAYSLLRQENPLKSQETFRIAAQWGRLASRQAWIERISESTEAGETPPKK